MGKCQLEGSADCEKSSYVNLIYTRIIYSFRPFVLVELLFKALHFFSQVLLNLGGHKILICFYATTLTMLLMHMYTPISAPPHNMIHARVLWLKTLHSITV